MKNKIGLLLILAFVLMVLFDISFASDTVIMSATFAEKTYKEQYAKDDTFIVDMIIENVCSDFGCLTGTMEYDSSKLEITRINSKGLVVNGEEELDTIYPKYINTISNDNANQIFFWIEDTKNRLKEGCIARVIFAVKEDCNSKDLVFTYKNIQASDYSLSKIYEFKQLKNSSITSGDSKEKVEDGFVSSNWAKEEIKAANKNDLIPEYLINADFTKPITRKEFAAIAVKLYEKISGRKAKESEKSPFIDTEDSYVLKAYVLEITYGTREDMFSPNAEITREQLATMLTRTVKKAGINTDIELENVTLFEDDSMLKNWSREAVYFMSSFNIINGIGKNFFGVTNNATIEQAVAISNRCAERFFV